MDEERLFREEAVPRNWRILESSSVPQDFDGWKLVPDFPQQVREKDQKGNQRPKPNPGISQVTCPGRDQQGEKKSQAKE